MIFCSLELTSFLLSCQSFPFFQITMPKCHKSYPNCIWHLPPEWFGLKFISVLLTKVCCNYATHIVRVYVSPSYPICIVQKLISISFWFKSFGKFIRFFCLLSVTCSDQLLEELVSYLPARFPSQILEYFVYDNSSDDESVHSFDSSVSPFYSEGSTYFS